MHGSPLSKYDNRILWESYNYRDYGITGEPYFDMDFNKILYLTDTGRRWDNESVSIRDKINITYTFQSGSHSTFDIIKAASENLLPPQIMITIHPQRWDNRLWPWIWEFVWQNIKNVGKRVVVRAS